MAERSGSSARGPSQPIVIRHLLTTKKPWLRNELTGSLEDLPSSSSRRGSVSLEKEMDSSVENLFRDLDDRSGSRRRGRPFRSVTLEERNKRSRSGNSARSSKVNGTDPLNDNDEDFIRLDSSDDYFDDATSGFHTPRRKKTPSPYVDCSETGRRKFRLDFDAEGFNRDDISATVHPGSRLQIHAIREDTEGGRRTTSEFSRRIRLPEDVDVAGLSCSLMDGRIVIDAPLLPKKKPLTTARILSSSSLNKSVPNPTSGSSGTNGRVSTVPAPQVVASAALNVPVVKVQNGVNVLSLCVEVGRLFRSDDVTVKVRNPVKVVVSAERTEVTDCSRMAASLVREFDLPARISSKTLKAGLTEQGLLRITAQLLPDDEE